MPTSSGVEPGQKRTLRRASTLRTSSSNTDLLHYRSKTDRSPRLVAIAKRSPRATQSAPPVNQKKLGTRIADLESQLGQAQEELKSLKGQLVSDQDAKKSAQEQIEGKAKKSAAPSKPTDIRIQKCSQRPKRQELKRENSITCVGEMLAENQHETDVFEVPVEKAAIVDLVKLSEQTNDVEFKLRAENVSIPDSLEPEKFPSFHDALAQKNEEISALKSRLEEKEKELGESIKEHESLNTQLLQEKSSQIAAAKSKEEEITSRFNQVINELEESKNSTFQINVKLEASERMNVALETEMKRLRVQTEQWKKAADAAAAVLSGDVEMNGRRVSERCGSMDNHIGRVYEAPGGGYGNGHVTSPSMIDDTDNIFDSSKRKGSGIRMFGDLWKKKGQK